MSEKVLETSALLYPTMIALVSCQRAEGRPNVLTVAWRGILRTHPPMVGILVQTTQFSYKLIMETKEFVINMPSEDLLWAVDICSWVSAGQTKRSLKKRV